MKIAERQAMFRALPESEQIHAVATHEAGHAVVLVEFAVPIKRVFLKRNDDGVVGQCQVSEQSSWSIEPPGNQRTVYRLGGYAAERVVLGKELCIHDEDYRFALRDFDWRKIPSSEFVVELLYEGDLKSSYEETLRIVSKRRHEVETIASELKRTFDSTYCETTGEDLRILLLERRG